MVCIARRKLINTKCSNMETSLFWQFLTGIAWKNLWISLKSFNEQYSIHSIKVRAHKIQSRQNTIPGELFSWQCSYCRGTVDFRPSFRDLGDLRAPLHSTPVLLDTATVTKLVQSQCLSTMHITQDNMDVISITPNRLVKNIASQLYFLCKIGQWNQYNTWVPCC